MRSTTLGRVVVAILAALATVYVVGRLLSVGGDVDARVVGSASQTPPPSQTNRLSTSPPATDVVTVAVSDVAAERADEDDLSAPLDRQLIEVADQLIEEADRHSARMAEMLALLHEQQRDQYRALLDEVRTKADIQRVSLLVDLVSDVVEREVEDANSAGALYCLVTDVLRTLDIGITGGPGDARAELQKARLLIWKYLLEARYVGRRAGIPSRDAAMAQRDYDRLTELSTSNEYDAYLKVALMYRAQMSMLPSRTRASPVAELLDTQPRVASFREAVDVARIKAWALVERAEQHSLENQNLWSYRALHLQHAIDFCENITRWSLPGTNDQDREYFAEVARRASVLLSSLRQRCAGAGVDIERPLARRASVISQFNYMKRSGLLN